MRPCTDYGRTPTAAITIQAEELDRIELHVGSGVDGLRPSGRGSADAADRRELDPTTRRLHVAAGRRVPRARTTSCFGAREVRIVLNPKGSNRVGPQVAIDLPAASGRDVSSRSFIVAGWAADLDASIDSGVDTVHVWAYPVSGRSRDAKPIFLGAAAFGGARPDVAALYGDRFGKSGYGLEVKGLAAGSYDIAVFAYSTVRAGFVPAKTVRVTVR